MKNNVKDIMGYVLTGVLGVLLVVYLVSVLHVRVITDKRVDEYGHATYDTVELHNGKIVERDDVMMTCTDPANVDWWFTY